ncbi:hypothetical protein T03_5797 [Trichinella britovi]|uniref:Uncharacterized protein n=1 Tax=Trichinella britovi TaxID=45882 RepID=A0A0V1D392_TRIBR|nr:hypothetical protein T03_5797 [Trichinella britovi]
MANKQLRKMIICEIFSNAINSCCSCQHGMYYIINIELVHTPALV